MAQEPIRLDDLISWVHDQHPEGDPLQHLEDAVSTSDRVGEVADALIGHFVDQARRAGASWTEIGQHMGVTKQAVQKRFTPRDVDELDLSDAKRFGRFTPRARSVVVATRAAAEEMRHDRVVNEHLVLGLLSEPEGLAAVAIRTLGPSLDQVRAAVTAVLQTRPPAKGRLHVRFDAETKKTLELSLREALHLGHNYIGTEHLLLGLLRNDDTRAAELLAGLGVTRDRATDWLVETLGGITVAKALEAVKAAGAAPAPAPTRKPSPKTASPKTAAAKRTPAKRAARKKAAGS